MAYEDAMREAIFLAKLARDLGLRPFHHDADIPSKDPATNVVPVCTDSDNAMILAGQKGYRRATRHYIIRHGMQMGGVRLVMIPSALNVADGLTKPLEKALLQADAQESEWS
jgi:hypothetical protein